MTKQDLFRKIPKVDQLMGRVDLRALSDMYGEQLVLDTVRDVLDAVRGAIAEINEKTMKDQSGKIVPDDEQICQRIAQEIISFAQPQLKRVINATGTVLHTNLGRAPLSEKAARYVADIAAGNANIEYNLHHGARGKRAAGCEELMIRLTGAEDALIVNNNAAAIMLILNTFCRGHEVIVSRGELVEIGGQFRMPDVMEAGGALLREVGTTNKTHLTDYEKAITPDTAAVMKVHTSNYKILGFTEEASIGELSELSHQHNLILIEDLGSGALVDLIQYGVGDEPTVGQSVHDGADLVCFSADKLLGGPQAGIVLGRHDLIHQMKAHPMMRALRIDKLVAAALEQTLLLYLNEKKAVSEIPVLAMLTASDEELIEKAGRLAAIISERMTGSDPVNVTVESCIDQVGGGSMPTVELCGAAVRIHRREQAGEKFRLKLLDLPVPIVGRLSEGDLWLSVRTVKEADFELIADELIPLLCGKDD